MSFIQFANQAQKELDAEYGRIKQKDDELSTRASAIAQQLATIDEKMTELNTRSSELQAREELVSARELRVRTDIEVTKDLEQSITERKRVEEMLAEISRKNDDTKMMLLDLSKRELALSEKMKSYREEIKQEITTKMLGI